jgi:hypothetical protein
MFERFDYDVKVGVDNAVEEYDPGDQCKKKIRRRGDGETRGNGRGFAA